MFDIFGIRAKRQAKKEAEEAKKLAEAQEKKRLYQERKAKIVAYLNDYREKEKEKRQAEFQTRLDSAAILNGICPKCHSRNVINTVVRGKGEIHGKGTSSYFGGGNLFGFSTYGIGHSKIDGEYDTLPVNKCKDCGNEWNIEKPEYPTEEDIFSTYSSSGPTCLYYRIDDYLTMKYNPYDDKEEANSLEEKREALCNKVSEYWNLKPYRTIPRYMIEYTLYQGVSEHDWRLDHLSKIFNYHKGDDKFSYRVSDELWEIIKKLLKWEGTEE